MQPWKRARGGSVSGLVVAFYFYALRGNRRREHPTPLANSGISFHRSTGSGHSRPFTSEARESQSCGSFMFLSLVVPLQAMAALPCVYLCLCVYCKPQTVLILMLGTYAYRATIAGSVSYLVLSRRIHPPSRQCVRTETEREWKRGQGEVPSPPVKSDPHSMTEWWPPSVGSSLYRCALLDLWVVRIGPTAGRLNFSRLDSSSACSSPNFSSRCQCDDTSLSLSLSFCVNLISINEETDWDFGSVVSVIGFVSRGITYRNGPDTPRMSLMPRHFLQRAFFCVIKVTLIDWSKTSSNRLFSEYPSYWTIP